MDQEKTYKWIQDRLHDLHSGSLSESDRILLDELAKTDPFIKDAIEGYEAHANHDHSLLLKVISQRIQNKSATRRPKLLPLSRGWVIQAVAASLVLILATWAVIYYVEKQNKGEFVNAESEVSSSIEHSTEVTLTGPDSAAEDLTANKEQAESGGHTSPPLSTSGASRESGATIKKADDYTLSDHGLSAPASAPHVPKETIEKTEKNNRKESAAILAESNVDKKDSKRDEGYYANQMNPELMSKRVTGQITDRKGSALAGSVISIPNTNLVTTADAQGKFEFYLPPSSSIVEVSNSGYRDTTLTVTGGHDDVVIMLDEERPAIPAGVLAGSESKLQQSTPEKMKSAALKDAGVAFLEYLKSNSLYPIQNNFSSTAKEVTVGFRVSAVGRPDVIRRVKSIADPKYMAEAIRLIQNGPDWRCDGDVYPCEREFTIYFQ